LVCQADPAHSFPVQEGIVHLGTGLEDPLVRREIEYEDASYRGDPRLTDRSIIRGFPETLPQLWPHTCHFGPDFRAIVEKLEFGPDSWVLDVGTASCWTSRILAQKGARVVALDVNAKPYYGLRAAEIQFKAHGVYFERVLESMTCLPFRDSTLDSIIFNASFHHTPDVRRTLEECHRVLKTGKSAIMLNEEFVALRHRLLPKPPASSEEGAHHAVPYRELRREARRAGFRVQCLLSGHIRRALESRPLGRLLARSAERLPGVVPQLNSAVIVLTRLPGPE